MILREIVRANQEELALKKYLGKKFGSTSPAEKKKFLDAVKDTTEAQVDKILNAFIEDALKGSSIRKRKRNWLILNLVVTIIITPTIGYAVNIENWFFVGACSVLLLIFQGFLIYNDA